ncbi:MAG: hypothetical protein PHP54_02990 [Clostridia bacterium]|nr:hypothetical protein [Clostridia bacterium]
MKKKMEAFIYKEDNDLENCKFIFDTKFENIKFYRNVEGILTQNRESETDEIQELNVFIGNMNSYVNNIKNLNLSFKENKYIVGKVEEVIIIDEIVRSTSCKSNLKYFYKTILLNNEERIIISSTYEKDSVFLLTDREFKLT